MIRLRFVARLTAVVVGALALTYRALAWSRRYGVRPSQPLAFAGRPSGSSRGAATQERASREATPREQGESRNQTIESPPNIHLPPPTIWPLAIAGGLTLVTFGVVTSMYFAILGAIVMIWAIFGWVREFIRHG